MTIETAGRKGACVGVEEIKDEVGVTEERDALNLRSGGNENGDGGIVSWDRKSICAN